MTAPTAIRVDPEFAELVDRLTARLKIGESIDLDEVVAGHPEYADELRRLFPAMKALAALSRSGDGTAADAGISLAEPLGDFRLVREVGRGGMGIVYEAVQRSLNRRVALKVLPLAAMMDPRQLARFRHEAQAAAMLHHGHIVPVFGVGCERGVHYFAMQLIDGRSLAAVVSEMAQGLTSSSNGSHRRLDPSGASGASSPLAPTAPVAARTTRKSGPDKAHFRRVAELIAQAADALEFAHSMGVVHRDVKPANLLLDGAGHLWVTDFGLARLGDGANLTVSGDLLGTLRYMSPEQALARHGLVDHRTDVYSLGATFYELLTLRPAVDGADRQEVLRRIAFEEPTPPRKLDKAIPVELETVALKALAKNPNDRYATAGEFADDLRRWLGDQTIKAKPPTLGQRAGKWARRHAAAVTASALGLMLTVAALTVGLFIAWRQQQQTQVAYTAMKDSYADARSALDQLSADIIDEYLARLPALSKKQREFVDRAMRHYERLLARPDCDRETRAAAAAAFWRAWDIHQWLGHQPAADVAIVRSVELYERLVADYPDEAAYALGLSKSLRTLSRQSQGSGQQQKAEAQLRRSLAIDERLFAASPTSERRRALAENHVALALYWQERGTAGMADAERDNRRGIELIRDQATSPNSQAKDRQLLSSIYCNLGNVLWQTGRLDEAEGHYRQAIALKEVLDRDEQDEFFPTDYRRDLCNCLANLANLLAARDRLPDAIELVTREVALRERMVADFPAVPGYRFDLSRRLNSMGQWLHELARPEEARRAYQRFGTLREQFAKDFPDAEKNAKLVELQVFRAIFLRRLGHVADAETELQAALDHVQRLVARVPYDWHYREALAGCRHSRGCLRLHQGRLEDAAAEYRTAAAIWDSLAGEWLDGEYRKAQARGHFCLELVLRLQGRPREAQAERRIAKSLDGPNDPFIVVQLANIYALAAGGFAAEPMRSDACATVAVGWLCQARADNHFQSRERLKQVLDVRDLDSIRERDDFRAFVASVSGPSSP